MPNHIFATGIQGLVGSHFAKTYQQAYTISSLDITDAQNPVDITNASQVLTALASKEPSTVLHLAAFTNVSEAWNQRDDTSAPAYKVNVEGTQNIVSACAQYGHHLIHISTAYVFDGEKEVLYTEADTINPIEWYGQTKADAEKIVMESSINWTILRIDQPFRSDSYPRLDIAHRILDGLTTNSLYPQFENHFFGPTFIDDFSKILDWGIRTKTTGLFHASSGEQWTDLEFATALANTHSILADIPKGDLDAYLETLDRPYQRNTAMDSSKLQALLDFKLTPISKALATIELTP